MSGRTRPVPRSESGNGLDMGARRIALVAGLLLLLSALFAACGGGEAGPTRAEVEETVRAETAQPEPGLSRAEVEEIVREELSAVPPPASPVAPLNEANVAEAVSRAMAEMPRSEPGLSRAEVEEIVRAAAADIAQSRPGLTEDEAERIARAAVAAIPPKSAPADYTRFFVESAIARYETQGLEAVLAHYNRAESVVGQWYVFIIDDNGLVIGHPDPERRGLDLKGWVGTDANGYEFGPDMLSATEEGKWVSYVYRNPESGGIGPGHTGALEYKHAWVVRHEGLLFVSGWHVSADEYTKFVVGEAITRYNSQGLEHTLDYYSSPDRVDAQWYVFIATPEGEVLGHYNAGDFAAHLEEMLDDGSFQASEDGTWVNHEDVNPVTGKVEDKHFWLVAHDGLVFGSGWHHGVYDQ